MSDIPFDTMAVAHRLRDSGFEEQLAEGITFAIRDGVTGGVATKADVQRLQSEIQIMQTAF